MGQMAISCWHPGTGGESLGERTATCGPESLRSRHEAAYFDRQHERMFGL